MNKFGSGLRVIGMIVLCCSCGYEKGEGSSHESIVVEEDIVSESNQPSINIVPNQLVESPLQLVINSNGVWQAFEGELGIVTLYDSEEKELGKDIVMATEDWMREGNVRFAAEIEFETSADNGCLVLVKNPGPGDGAEAGDSSTVSIPVRFH